MRARFNLLVEDIEQINQCDGFIQLLSKGRVVVALEQKWINFKFEVITEKD